MRLIDGDALKKQFNSSTYGMAVKSIIDDAPTIDAEPVIRCANCVNGIANVTPQSSYLDPPQVDGIKCCVHGRIMDFTDFCSLGSCGAKMDESEGE